MQPLTHAIGVTGLRCLQRPDLAKCTIGRVDAVVRSLVRAVPGDAGKAGQELRQHPARVAETARQTRHVQAVRGAYMMTATPTRQIAAPIRS